jgi:predicted nucleotidyltransferase
MVSPELIQRAGEALAAAAGGSARVILFGSHARGEARADSDVDFLVIEPKVEDRQMEWTRLRRALSEIQLPLDLVVIDETVATRRAKVPGTLVYHAVRDGRVIAQP